MRHPRPTALKAVALGLTPVNPGIVTDRTKAFYASCGDIKELKGGGDPDRCRIADLPLRPCEAPANRGRAFHL
jgi:hypothetical protein